MTDFAIKFEELKSQNVVLQNSFSELKEDFKKLDGKVDKIKSVINGNGEHGLKTQVALNREAIKDLNNEKHWRRGAYFAIFTMLIKEVATFVM